MAYPLHNFYETFSIYKKFHGRLTVKIWGFAQGVPELWGFTSGCIVSNIQRSPAGRRNYAPDAKTFLTCRHGMDLFCHHAQLGGTGITRFARGWLKGSKLFVCLFVVRHAFDWRRL